MPGSTGGSWKRSDWSGSPKWDNPTGNRGHQGFWTYRQNHATAPVPDPTHAWSDVWVTSTVQPTGTTSTSLAFTKAIRWPSWISRYFVVPSTSVWLPGTLLSMLVA